MEALHVGSSHGVLHLYFIALYNQSDVLLLEDQKKNYHSGLSPACIAP